MSEQTPRRRRADRVYTPEENEAAPCRRRMNADEPRADAERASIIRLRSSSRTLRRIRSMPCRQTSRSMCLRTRRPRP